MTEATFTMGAVAGPAWHVSVPVLEHEQRHDYSDGSRHGYLFLTAQLAVYPGYQPGDVFYRLSGPNIRQDGTPGARTLSRRVSRAEAEKSYPAALEVAKTMMTDGAGRVLANAERVAADIARVIAGEQGQ